MVIRRSGVIWGGLFILAGFLLLLQNFGIITVSIWDILWPLVIILIGANLLLGTVRRGSRSSSAEQLTIPLDNARRASIEINHGAGQIQVNPGTDPTELVGGEFFGGVNQETHQDGDFTRVRLSAPAETFAGFPWSVGRDSGYNWTIRINPAMDTSLILKTGASENTLDLSDLKLSNLRLETGASSTTVYLPKNAGHTLVNIEAGVASVNLRVPTEVAARIRNKSGLSGISIDSTRFPRMGDVYEAPDFSSAMNQIEIMVQTGVGSVDIR